jgi:hypothetical protein
MVASLELRARARRRVGIGGEHSAWWMKCAWSLAVEVDTTLAAMDMVGRWGGYCGHWLTAGLKRYHPQSCVHAFVPAHDCASTMCDGTPNFGEEYIAPHVA